MKQSFFGGFAVVLLTLLFACSGNSTRRDDSGQTNTDNIETTDTVNYMHEYNLDGTVEVGGIHYNYEFSFNNDKSLPTVTTEEGLTYYDNNVRLYITRGSERVYEHKFTKEFFRDLIPESDYKRSVLAGFNFNYMQEDSHDRFYFIAVVGDPDETSDISYSIAIAIDSKGNVTRKVVTSIDVEPINDNLNKDPEENDA